MIEQLDGVSRLVGDVLVSRIDETVAGSGMDHAGLATELRALGGEINKAAKSIGSINSAFSLQEVEFERVSDGEAEVGLLLPREVVGNRLNELAAELLQINKLARAINELSGATEYDPTVRTISSTDWQVFLDLDPAQIVIWVLAIERIVALFKSNLEIKALQEQLKSKELPKKIIDLIEAEIEKRMSTGLSDLAKKIRQDYKVSVDEGRANELETQLRHGLIHLAKRMNQGAQIEVNVSVPAEPTEPEPEVGGKVDPGVQKQIEAQKQRIAQLRTLRTRAHAASSETMRLESNEQLLLRYFESADGEKKP